MIAAAQRTLDDICFNPIDLSQIEPGFGYLVSTGNAKSVHDTEHVMSQIQSTLRDISKSIITPAAAHHVLRSFLSGQFTDSNLLLLRSDGAMVGPNGGTPAHLSPRHQEAEVEQFRRKPEFQQAQRLALQLNARQTKCDHQGGIDHNSSVGTGSGDQLRATNCQAHVTELTPQADPEHEQGYRRACPLSNHHLDHLLVINQTHRQGQRRGEEQEPTSSFQNRKLLPAHAPLLRACWTQTEHGHHRRFPIKVPVGRQA